MLFAQGWLLPDLVNVECAMFVVILVLSSLTGFFAGILGLMFGLPLLNAVTLWISVSMMLPCIVLLCRQISLALHSGARRPSEIQS